MSQGELDTIQSASKKVVFKKKNNLEAKDNSNQKKEVTFQDLLKQQKDRKDPFKPADKRIYQRKPFVSPAAQKAQIEREAKFKNLIPNE